MKKIIRKSVYVSVLLLVFSGVISCEKDFTDIGTGIIGNTKFTTDSIFLEVEVTQRDIDAVRGDNIAISSIGEYLLGVYQDPQDNYEKIEASIVSQISLADDINVKDGKTDATTVTSVFDNAFIKLPYIATRKTNNTDGTPDFELDSVLGTTLLGVKLNVFRNNTYLNTLNPQNPAQGNKYSTDFAYQKGELLNKTPDFLFIPNENDTIYSYERNYKGGTFKDTLRLANSNPFLVIPLDKTKMKSLFFDKFEDDEFASQEALNAYFKGLIIEATGDENSLVPFSFAGNLRPSLEINFTNAVLETETGKTDSIKKTASFPLSGVQNRIYKMTPESMTAGNNQVIIQGVAGKVADVKILQGTKLDELRKKDWLINDATLTFYIDQSRDMSAIPLRLHLYKEEANYAAQIKDAYSEGFNVFSGILQKEGDDNDRYSFKITDYISDVLGPNAAKNSNLVLKVYNTTDNPIKNQVTDTIVTNYNWNPRAVTITNHLPNNGEIKGTRKAQLKITYSEKKN